MPRNNKDIDPYDERHYPVDESQKYAAQYGTSLYGSGTDPSKLYDYLSSRPNDIGSDILAKWFGSGLTSAQKATNALNVAEAQKQRDWETTMSNTAHQREVVDMQKAGLNVALMYGNGSSGASTPSGATASAASADSAGGFSFQDFVSMLSLPLQLSQMSANVKKTRAETEVIGLDAAWQEKTLDARVRATDLANNATEANIRQVSESRNLILENIKKTIAETKNESDRNFLVHAETRLREAEAKQILSLLPYNELLLGAQTDAQKASALASTIHALYEQHMIDSGYIEASIKSMREQSAAALKGAAAQAQLAEVNAALQQFKEAIYTGKVYDPEQKGINGVVAKGLNSLISSISALTTAIGGPLSGLMH